MRIFMTDEDCYYLKEPSGNFWEFLRDLPPMLITKERSAGYADGPEVMFGDAPPWVQHEVNSLIEGGYVDWGE